MCTKNISIYKSSIKTIFTSFGQNTAEFYDKHILFNRVLCIFWSEFRLETRYFALHLTEKFLKDWSPLRYDLGRSIVVVIDNINEFCLVNRFTGSQPTR